MIATYIGLGSNLHEPLLQLRRAVPAIARLPRSQLAAVSNAYRSSAVGPGDQPDYLNAVMRLDTALPAAALLIYLQEIEQQQGRVRTIRWGPRSLDLDILLYGDTCINTPTLCVPHPALHLRNFVLYPLAQVAGPNLVLPDGTELGTLIARCPQADLVDTGVRLSDGQGSDRADV